MRGAMQRAQSIHMGRRGRLSIAASARGSKNFLSGMGELDLNDFNSSLGSPLESYEEATLSLVGGKALQCWRLAKYGFPVRKLAACVVCCTLSCARIIYHKLISYAHIICSYLLCIIYHMLIISYHSYIISCQYRNPTHSVCIYFTDICLLSTHRGCRSSGVD